MDLVASEATSNGLKAQLICSVRGERGIEQDVEDREDVALTEIGDRLLEGLEVDGIPVTSISLSAGLLWKT